ncbi:MAG: iron ABC transporter permease [Firmicutes bacterium]|jgi:iron complex transport system permease protein|nr:iron ABC transporter permease [Bacillota bacterium]
MKDNKFRIFMGMAVVALIVFFIAAMSLGRYMIPFDKVIDIVLGNIFGYEGQWTKIEETVVMSIRFPRVLLSVFIGAGLSVSGVSMQALFSNPLVSPHILGVSYGAGFGAALGILFSDKVAIIQILAITFGVVAICVTYLVSKTKNGIQLYMLVLSGVVVGSLFQAFISLIKYVADPEEKLPTIVYWLMGSLSGTSMEDLKIGIPLIGLSVLGLFIFRWQLNVLSLNEEEAISMGINIKILRAIVVITTTIISAASVSLCGIVGFVGLVIPHFSRMIIGCEHRKLIPVSIVIGGIYLLIIDTLSRTITAAEIPLSILTAVVGAPFFAYLLRKKGAGVDV